MVRSINIINANLSPLIGRLGRPVKTGSPQVLLGGPGGQGTRVEVSPDTSRARSEERRVGKEC